MMGWSAWTDSRFRPTVKVWPSSTKSMDMPEVPPFSANNYLVFGTDNPCKEKSRSGRAFPEMTS
jgi:hypothetical protein